MEKREKRNLAKPIGLMALIVLLFSAPPFIPNPYYVHMLTMLLINLILVVSFRFITTMGGWSFAHVPLMGLGGYTSALLTIRLDWPFWLTLPLGGLAAALISLLISYPVLRTRGIYFFLSTFAAGEALRTSWIRLKNPFGGHDGVTGIPRPSSISMPGLPAIDFSNIAPYYILVLLVTLLSLAILYRLEKSRVGDTLKALASQETLAKSIGIDPQRYRTLAFVTGSFFAGIAGVLFAHYLKIITPGNFGFVYALNILVYVIAGGTATFVGPIIGTITLTVVAEALRGFAQYVPLIFGFILIATLLFLPAGLESFPQRISPWLERLRVGNWRGKG